MNLVGGDVWGGKAGDASSDGEREGGVVGRLAPAFRNALTALSRPAARAIAPEREKEVA